MKPPSDILGIISARKATGEPYALATVVRTVAATAAKAGAKAVILPDGTVWQGGVGGGWVAKNMCPSQGTMDIFVEPVLPRPHVVVCGWSPVAVAVADLAGRSGFGVTVCAPAAEQSSFEEVDRRIEGYALPVADPGARYVVVSTQGRGDEDALLAALAVDVDYVAFVGSRRKAQMLKTTLAERGVAPERLAKLRAPAGLDLGAITPEEIAISILAEIVAARRGKHSRGSPPKS